MKLYVDIRLHFIFVKKTHLKGIYVVACVSILIQTDITLGECVGVWWGGINEISK